MSDKGNDDKRNRKQADSFHLFTACHREGIPSLLATHANQSQIPGLSPTSAKKDYVHRYAYRTYADPYGLLYPANNRPTFRVYRQRQGLALAPNHQ